MTQFTPELVKCLRNRFAAHRQLGQWGAAAGDVVRALELRELFLEGDGLAKLVRQEFAGLLGRLRDLTQEERVRLYDELGDVAEVVRGLVEQDEA